MKQLAIITTGLANLASVEAALGRVGVRAVRTTDANLVATSDHVILPGVGAFGAGMDSLRDAGLVEALAERVRAGRPTLAICLGLQLLAAASEETPGVRGLAVLDDVIRELPVGLPRPQMGWNYVRAPEDSRFMRDGYAYFAHGFALRDAPKDWLAARTTYGGPVVAAVERGDVLGCQFHPELSGDWGQELVGRWLEVTGRASWRMSC